MSKIIFFGTPDYIIPVLKALKAEHEIVAVVTQPPKPVGRKQTLTPSPVASWATKNNVLSIDGEPEKIITQLNKLGADIGVLASYGRILPASLLETLPHGIINIHPSCLPRWRGPAPVEATIASGDIPGITFIKLNEKMDHGPILAQYPQTSFPLNTYTKAELLDLLFKKAAGLLVDFLPQYLAGKVNPKDQDHTKATYTKLLKKDDGFIPPIYLKTSVQGVPLNREKWQIRWMLDTQKNPYSFIPNTILLDRFIRAMSPWPGAWTTIDLNGKPKRLKVLSAHIQEKQLILDKVQLEGKTQVSWDEFKKAYPSFEKHFG